MPFTSCDQLARGCEENVILVWAAAAEGIMHNMLLPFYSYEGDHSSHRRLAIFEKRVRAAVSMPWQHRQVPECHFIDHLSAKLPTMPQGQGPA